MNIKTLSAIVGLGLSVVTISAKAQKTITEGIASYSTEMRGNPAEVKEYFTPDSGASIVTFGAGNVKMLTTAKHDYLAVLLDIPVASIKKAGIATPAEMESYASMIPTFTYTPTAETKTISGFNCKKVVAKDTKSGKTYDVWVTNDISVPSTAIPFYYGSIGGYPVQFTAFQQGQEISITIKSVVAGKAPAGTFGIAKDFDKVTMEELNPGQ